MSELEKDEKAFLAYVIWRASIYLKEEMRG